MKHLLCILILVAAVLSDPDLKAILKKSNDQFTANMFQEVVKSERNKSCVLSAFSVLSPLAQLALASVGESHDEILKAIGFPNNNVTKQVFSELNSRLRSVKGVDLELANKIYVGKNYSLNDKFAALSKKDFSSEVENIDFGNSTNAAVEINAWVESHTHKRIRDLVTPDSFDKSTTAVLVNAIYFKGPWQNPFDKYLTENRSFNVTKNQTSSIPMMLQINSFKYGESKEFDAKFLEMKYVGGETSLLVALPNKIDGINDLIEKFQDPAALNKAHKNISDNVVRVYLPKFQIETTTDLTGILEKINIKDLFQPGHANLSNLLKETSDVYVSSAIQKAFIEVNEEGAEATAVNEVSIVREKDEIVSYIKPKEFKADHPFLFFIMEQNNILFNGVFRS